MTLSRLRPALVGAALAACLSLAPAALLAQPDFGDDTSRWANDGECDDPRFAGAGTAETLLDEDRGHDATDCRQLFNTGRITLRASAAGATDYGDDTGEWARDGECDDPRFEGDGMASVLLDADAFHDATDCRELADQGRIQLREDAGVRVERGRLEKGDDTLASGEYSDVYTFTASSGQRAVVDLRSGDFDPYLFLRAPSGEQFDNDDFEGDANRSLLSLDLTQSGEYRVTVTSYQKAETGAYTLSMDVGRSKTLVARVDHSGRLEDGDTTLQSGELYDSYDFEGSPGQRVTIDLRSTAFDTYLILQDPAGEQAENDDAADDSDLGHSRVEADLTEAGTYRVLVTSYESGESGAYTLSIAPSDAPRSPASRDVQTLTVGARPTSGELEQNDATFEAGEYQDTYVFDGEAGQTVRIELSSTDFDTYLGVVTPSGEEIANDDFEGDTDRSVIELKLPESGRYRVQATSYAAAETGRYRLALTTTATEVPSERRAQGRVYGLFAGISDYEPPNTDLQYTAEDARRIRDALIDGGGMRAADAHMLVDSEATVGNVTRAIRDIAGRMGPNDTFVMFYSGHGGQVPRADGPAASDPDAMDETLALYDGEMRDDELRALFDEIEQGTVLLWLDSCYSGGFAKDIVSAPGRMGIFSSEEDITSNVASKFRAGGYLSLFLDEAIAQGLADHDGDRAITAIELSQYLHERYRADVKSAEPAGIVRTEMTLGYQHLVVDRGSIGAYDVLFER